MPGKRYRVTGTQPVLGNRPGSAFEADIPANQEKALLEGGAIEIVEARQPPPAGGTNPNTPKAPASDDQKEGR